jgi:hypothetical protein
MTRSTISGNVPAESAERMSDAGDLSDADLAMIETLAEQKVRERLYESPEYLLDLMDGIEPKEYAGQLQRCLQELSPACHGDQISLNAVTTALHQIEQHFLREARRLWLDECKDEAEHELFGERE